MKSPAPFSYRGVLPSSKSILNRLLILQSFRPDLEVHGDASADDVVKMKNALKQLLRGEDADCGHAGTTLRFLALRASRLPGRHRLVGSARLFQRPQAEIPTLIRQLGCRCEIEGQSLIIEGDGWNIPATGLRVDRSISSQFASAVVLSAWDLTQPLRLEFDGSVVSESYFQMTLNLVRKAGMAWRSVGPSTLEVPARSALAATALTAEIDVSSAFAVAAFAALAGEAVFKKWPEPSLQPDSAFVAILQKMGCETRVKKTTGGYTLTVRKPTHGLKPVDWPLLDSPDLFPVLSVLCAFADGASRLHSAPHLQHKESDRLNKSAELVRMLGREFEILEGGTGMVIKGRPLSSGVPTQAYRYDTDHDHRLAFAAALARRGGLNIEILNPEVVNKSFPEFWQVAEGHP